MWEKELTDKYMHKYTTTWGRQFGPELFPKTSDGRKDDGVLTPKRQRALQDKKNDILKRIQRSRNPGQFASMTTEGEELEKLQKKTR